MPIQWSPDLETGIAEIDLQHRSIFDKINDMLEASRSGKARQEVRNLLAFLGDYVVTHFQAEEKFMAECSYPHLDAHRSAHTLFINDFTKLKAQFDSEGASLSLTLATQRRVVDWLFDHIKSTDKAMANHIRHCDLASSPTRRK